jgi:hypothetical protein
MVMGLHVARRNWRRTRGEPSQRIDYSWDDIVPLSDGNASKANCRHKFCRREQCPSAPKVFADVILELICMLSDTSKRSPRETRDETRKVKVHDLRVVVHFQSAMSLNVEKDSSLPLGMTTKISICHLEQSERSVPN